MGKPRLSVTDRALLFLWNNGSNNMEGYAAGCVGAELWKERKGHVIASHGGGDYAAQMLLGRMKKSGLVRVRSGPGSSRWELTAAGKVAAVRVARWMTAQDVESA